MTPIIIAASGDQDQPLEIETLAQIFKALGDPNRLRLLSQLLGAGTGQNVGQTAGCCGVDLSVVSRHLNVLRRAGILTKEKVGKEVVYRIDPQRLPTVLRSLADTMETCCQESFTSKETENENER